MGLYLLITEMSRLFFYRCCLMAAVFMAWAETPERRDMLKMCSRSGVMQSETFFEEPCW